MNRHSTILLGMLLISSVWASAVSRTALTVEVMSANTETIPLSSDNNGAPKDCNLMDFSAYCHHSRNAIVHHTMVVQDNSGKSYTISCTVDTIWSKCIALPVGVKFDAQWTKHGIAISYPNAKGKEVKQAYKVVPAAETTVASNAQPKSVVAEPENNAAPATDTVSETSPGTVKCNFTSNPSGADITLDGEYVGNAPSTIAVAAGKHVVEFSMQGFAKWKRMLTVTSGSVVDVNANLQRTH